ncbi:hypothetical protein [Aeoliella sp. SH292]|uniref:hypothetical protein n=1 Tax=Aeoliella sp. SH292 TaxID=3454464 RepID=UPI003F984DFB
MSSASPQVIDYLTRQLGRNPIHESGEIVRARAKAFKLEQKTATPAKSASPSGQRQKVRDELEKIREQCFSGPVEPLLQSLVALPLADYPDLAVLAKRLRVILGSRIKLPTLSQNPQFDGDFFSVLKQVLVSPARDVAVLREQVLASFRHKRNRKRGQGMIRLLKSETPELYALEADWLDSLARYRGGNALFGTAEHPADTYVAKSSGGTHYGWWLWLGAMVVLGVLRGISNSDSRDASKNKYTPYTPPTTQQSIDLQKGLPNLSRELQESESLPNESAQDRSRRPTIEREQRRQDVEQRPDARNQRVQNFFEETKREIERSRREAKEAIERNRRNMETPSINDRPDPLERHGAQTPTPDFRGAPFATPRVVPMPTMPSAPRP